MAAASAHDGLMPGTLRLGRIHGIPIGLHYSWFLIAGLITISLTAHFRSTNPDWPLALTFILSAGTAVLFFATLLLHELSHAFVARSRDLPVRSITLFALGGIANIGKDATSATTEFLVAIVGPIVSFSIGAICIGVAQSLGWSVGEGGGGVIGAVLGWLGSINILLAIFNLIPGYPLDGGRVLRAVLWGIYKNADRATRNAARTGQVVAGIFIAWGLVQFFAGVGIGGLWLALIGWFLLMAAQASDAEVTMRSSLRGVRVADVMAQDCATVHPHMGVQELVEDVLLRTGRRCVIVKNNEDRILGLVTPHEVRSVERSKWPEVTVTDVMRPLEVLRTVTPDTPVEEALRVMAQDDLNQLPVVSDGRLEGMVSRGHILQLVQSRSELKAA